MVGKLSSTACCTLYESAAIIHLLFLSTLRCLHTKTCFVTLSTFLPYHCSHCCTIFAHECSTLTQTWLPLVTTGTWQCGTAEVCIKGTLKTKWRLSVSIDNRVLITKTALSLKTELLCNRKPKNELQELPMIVRSHNCNAYIDTDVWRQIPEAMLCPHSFENSYNQFFPA